MNRMVLTAVAVALVLAGCGGSRSASNPGSTRAGDSSAPSVTQQKVIATKLQTPWGLAFLPDGSALVSERDSGAIKRVVPQSGGEATVTQVGSVSGVAHPAGSEGGLLGLAVEPGADPKTVFAYVTTAVDNRILSIPWDGSVLGTQLPVLTGIPAATRHDGGRIAFGPDGFLYAGTGDAGNMGNSQNLSSLGGKILRITGDGKPAPGNPFGGSPVWSYGHRNVQGLAFDNQGRLWASEFGANAHDELNLITKGSNYGWPIIEGQGGAPQFSDPYAQWPTADASPSGLAIVGDWAYMAALRGERLWQVDIKNQQSSDPNGLFVGTYGRLRTVTNAPDGTVWLTSSNTDGRGNPSPNDDKILQLVIN